MPRRLFARSVGAAATVAAAVTVATVATTLLVPVAAQAAPGHGRSALDVHVTRSGRVLAPAHTHPGLVQLSTHRRAIFLLKARRAGASKRDVAKRIARQGPRSLLARYRIITLASPPSDNVVRLSRGVYFLVDVDTTHFHADRIARMVVRGPRVDMARIPASRPAVVTRNGHLIIPARLHRNRWLHVENHGNRLAEVVLVRLPPRVHIRPHVTPTTRLGVAPLRRAVVRTSSRRLQAQRIVRFSVLAALSGRRTVWNRVPTYPGRYIAVAATFGPGSGSARGVTEHERIVHVH